MLEIGKLDSELLRQIVFDNIRFRRPEIITRPGIGEDCAVIDFGENECVMSTDPISSAINQIGRLAIHISCNDIASNGVQPLGITLAVMLPPGTTEEEINEMMRQAGEASEELQVEIIGGHTEITDAVKQPVIVSTAVGRAPKGGSQDAKDMAVGDLIMITKAAGLEGSGVIANDFEEELAEFMKADEIEEAKSMLEEVSVVTEGVAAGKIGTHGMHDVTEGGILGAVWEMCDIAGLGVEIWEDKIPVRPVTAKICEHFDINVFRLISSGAMVIVVPRDKKDEMAAAMKAKNVPASYIGEVKEKAFGLMLKSGEDGSLSEIVPPYSDELYKVVAR